ncbi:MAG: AraC family transcriptional regulator [Verrucomicrobiota bacterium]|nr:AraC family transcriptional regulator [Verrucomicrobiota bacterium]
MLTKEKNTFEWNEVRPVFLNKERISFLSRITNCGHHIISDSSYNWNGLERNSTGDDSAILQYTFSGNGKLEYDNESFTLKKGDMMILHTPYKYRYYYEETSLPWEFFYFTFKGKEILKMLRIIENVHGSVITIPADSEVISFFQKVLQLFRNGYIDSVFDRSSYAHRIFAILNAFLNKVIPTEEIPDSGILKAIQYVEKNYAEQISPVEIATVSGYSRAQCNRLFKKYKQMPSGKYLEHVRMEKALKYLMEKKKNVNEIAYFCGYNSFSYFCKVFRKCFECSPSDFQKKVR